MPLEDEEEEKQIDTFSSLLTVGAVALTVLVGLLGLPRARGLLVQHGHEKASGVLGMGQNPHRPKKHIKSIHVTY